MKGPIAKHFNPVETATHRTPSKYRRIAVALAKKMPVSDVAYLFGVSTTTIRDWSSDPANHPATVGRIEILHQN
jgi:hypothetical protein